MALWHWNTVRSYHDPHSLIFSPTNSGFCIIKNSAVFSWINELTGKPSFCTTLAYFLAANLDWSSLQNKKDTSMSQATSNYTTNPSDKRIVEGAWGSPLDNFSNVLGSNTLKLLWWQTSCCTKWTLKNKKKSRQQALFARHKRAMINKQFVRYFAWITHLNQLVHISRHTLCQRHF